MLSRVNISDQQSANIKNIFMVCPNFEERSIGFLDSLDSLDTSNFFFFITKLKGANAQDMLDEIKDENTKEAIDRLKANKINYEYQKFQYPLKDLKQYINAILKYIKSITLDCNLYIDISSMPRNLIFRFLDFIFAHIHQNYIKIDQLIIRSVYICYTPAIDYPVTDNIDQIGGIKGIYTNQPFHSLIRDCDKVDLFMFTAGNTYDASQTYSQSDEDGVNSSISRHVLVFLNKDNLFHSYKKIGQNIRLISMAMDNRDKMTYFYSIEQISNILCEEVKHIFIDNQRFEKSFLAVGAFGTKTICLCSYLAKKKFEILAQNNTNHQSDILTNDIGQYVSIYSIGKKNSEYYKIEFSKLID
jgi:hypothetical protein